MRSFICKLVYWDYVEVVRIYFMGFIAVTDYG